MKKKCPTCGLESEEGEWTRLFRIYRAVDKFLESSDPDPDVTHTLKIHPVYFEAVLEGRKTFEVRRGNDRTYKEGDTVRLREFVTDFSGRELVVQVVYVMHGPPLLPEDCWVFGIRKMD